MTRRIPFLILAALAGCGEVPSSEREAQPPTRPAKPAADRITCARAGTAALAPVCGVGRTLSAEGLVLTLRHPDGGFRRLLVTSDGRGVIAADGAQQARVRIIDDRQIEVTLAGDRYRLPATVRGAR